MSKFQTYQRRVTTGYMRPYVPGESLDGVSVSQTDTPGPGCMIATQPDNRDDQWLVSAEYFGKNFLPEPIA